MVRYAERNWNRFFTHNKKTTIRTKPLKVGWSSAWSGSRFKPKSLGKVYTHPFSKSCLVKELTEEDAKNDGFNSRDELIIELAQLNRGLTTETPVWIHPSEPEAIKQKILGV